MMKKVSMLLLALATSNGAFASEVGARDPQVVDAPKIELAVAERGVSSSWTETPFEVMATSYQIEELEIRTQEMFESLDDNLSALIAGKLEAKIDL